MSDKGHESADRGRLAGAELMELRRGSDQSQPAEVSQSALQTALASSKSAQNKPTQARKGADEHTRELESQNETDTNQSNSEDVLNDVETRNSMLEEALFQAEEKSRRLEAALAEAQERQCELETALKEAAERHKSLVEELVGGYWETDLAGRYIFVNDRVVRSHGRSREELFRLKSNDYMDESNSSHMVAAFKQIFMTGRPVRDIAHELIRADGSRRHIEANVALIRNAAGKPVGFRGVSQDVSERKRIEEALRQSEERYRTIVEEVADSYWETDLIGHFTFFNNQVLVEQKRTREEDRKSTRLNSSHLGISYAVFCLKKKKQINKISGTTTSSDECRNRSGST